MEDKFKKFKPPSKDSFKQLSIKNGTNKSKEKGFTKSDTMKATSEVSFEKIVTNALKIPGVKVNRTDFLREMFEDEHVDIDNIIEVGPVAAGCPQEMLNYMANKMILKRTSESSIASFAAGIPGGLAMAATIPLDTLQFYGMTLRMAQEITYLYGAKDLWKDGKVDSDLVRSQLILYCGVMVGVSGAAAGLRLISAHVAKQIGESLAKQALTKTIWYPIIKQIGKSLGINITKGVVSKGATKIVPVLGGVLSGGLTFLSMRPMGVRLVNVLNEANYEYSEQKALEDYHVLEQIAEEYEESEEVDIEYEEIIPETYDEEMTYEDEISESTEDIFATLEKLAKLKDLGIVTEEEFEAKKKELLSRI